MNFVDFTKQRLQAMMQYRCSRCKAMPGEPCRKPNGRILDYCHAPRVDKAIHD